jgi:hypothetical protein
VRIESRLHGQQHREIGDIPGHRPEHTHGRQPGIRRVRRDATDAGAKAIDAVPPGRIAQASAIVGSVRQRHHAQSECHRCAPAAAARRARCVVGVARRAEHRVECVRPEPKLRHVGLADEDCARPAQPRHHERVRRRHEILQYRRPHRRADALDVLEVFYGMRKSVQRPERFTASELHVPLACLRKQPTPILNRDHGVHAGVELLDMVEIRRHHLDARDSTAVNRRSEGGGIHQDQIVHDGLSMTSPQCQGEPGRPASRTHRNPDSSPQARHCSGRGRISSGGPRGVRVS